MRKPRSVHIPHNHVAYHQSVLIHALGGPYSGAFFTVDWDRMLLELYGKEEITIPLGDISSITVTGTNTGPCSFIFEHKDERLLDEDAIRLAYAKQAWTNNGTFSFHRGSGRRTMTRGERLLAELLS